MKAANGITDNSECQANNIVIREKSTPSELDSLVFRQLLAASKAAERVIGCLFESQCITAEPLEQIWNNLATAIEAAQQALPTDHPAQLNISAKEKLNGDIPTGHVRVLCGSDASRNRHRRMVLQKEKGERPMRTMRKITLALATALLLSKPLLLQAQVQVAPTFQGAVNDIRTIAIAAGTLVAGMVGLVGLGRTAYKLSQGDTDSMTALIFAIVGIVLGFLANTFIA
jgi:hypothetical protein